MKKIIGYHFVWHVWNNDLVLLFYLSCMLLIHTQHPSFCWFFTKFTTFLPILMKPSILSILLKITFTFIHHLYKINTTNSLQCYTVKICSQWHRKVNKRNNSNCCSSYKSWSRVWKIVNRYNLMKVKKNVAKQNSN